eukprot:4969257-Ditylum_brightwellii.AAC.1
MLLKSGDSINDDDKKEYFVGDPCASKQIRRHHNSHVLQCMQKLHQNLKILKEDKEEYNPLTLDNDYCGIDGPEFDQSGVQCSSR